MENLRWSDVQEEAQKSFGDLLAKIQHDVKHDAHEYPTDSWEREQFELKQFECADEWVRQVFQVYCDALSRLGHEGEVQQTIIWRNGISGFIDHRVKPLLEVAFGVTDKDREFLRVGEIAVKRLNKIRDGHSLDKTLPKLKVEAVERVIEELKEQWQAKLTASNVNGASQSPMIDSQGSSSYLDSVLDQFQRTMQQTDDMMAEVRRAENEKHRREMDLRYRDLERARELEHARELAKISETKEVGAKARAGKGASDVEGTQPQDGESKAGSQSDSNTNRETKKLVSKKRDLSNYLEPANLTDRQHECISLFLEYGLRKSEIARRLDIDRKTLDEHLSAARKRIDMAGIKMRSDKKLAKNRPEDTRTR